MFLNDANNTFKGGKANTNCESGIFLQEAVQSDRQFDRFNNGTFKINTLCWGIKELQKITYAKT